MINLNELARGGTVCLSCAGLMLDADGEADAETLQDVHYAINGLTYLLSSGNGDVKLDDNTVTTLCTVLFLVCVDATGTITVVKGTEVLNTAITNGTSVLKWPAPTANTCPIGALKVKNATSSVFTGGTTHQDATDITTTYYNFFTVPVAPLTS